MAPGNILFALHAHLPYVRHPEHEKFLEEYWFFEAVSETYLPLLRMMERLEADGVPMRMTLSVSPTLAGMLRDELLQERYVRHVESLLGLVEKEKVRVAGDPALEQIVAMYEEFYRRNLADFEDKYRRNILPGFSHFEEIGYLDIITSPATHPYLPNYKEYPETIHAQLQVAQESHQRSFGRLPKGVWLPEFGYYPGLERQLEPFGLEYFFSSAHAVLFADPKPQYGVYAPVSCPNGVKVFGRDLASAAAVWSAEDGYPGDVSYREFYRDIGFDLPVDYLQDCLPGGRIRVNTGLKYHAITGPGDHKDFYQPEKAASKVREHAENFLFRRVQQVNKASRYMDREPVVVCPYDAELFGHWWFEGVAWLESVFRLLHTDYSRLKAVTAGDYLSRQGDQQEVLPSFTSWGNKGYSEVWLDGSNDWIYRHTHKVLDRMRELVSRFPDESSLKERALNQAAREVLLSQASDWPFIMRTGTTVPYAVRRIKEHVNNFTKIYDALCRNTISTEWLTKLERKNNFFPGIDYRIFRDSRRS